MVFFYVASRGPRLQPLFVHRTILATVSVDA
jgi:hypothetical protein